MFFIWFFYTHMILFIKGTLSGELIFNGSWTVENKEMKKFKALKDVLKILVCSDSFPFSGFIIRFMIKVIHFYHLFLF